MLISAQDFVKWWGNSSELIQFAPLVVENLELARESKEFLTAAGIPAKSPYRIYFTELLRDLPNIVEKYGGEYDLDEKCHWLRVLGYFKNELLSHISAFQCLQEQTGYVIEVTRLGGPVYLPFFANSSIQQHAEFLLIRKQYDEWLNSRQDSIDEMELVRYGQAISKQLHLIDSEACREADNYRLHGGFLSQNGFESRVWTEAILSLETDGFWY